MPRGAAWTARRTRSPPTTRPHTEVDKHVEFGWAANGISGIETAIGIVLAAVDAGVLPLARAIEALTTGPAAVLGRHGGRRRARFRDGEPADLVVIDRGATWRVDARRRSGRRARTRRCSGASCAGVVRLTIAGGRVAYVR